IEMFDHPGSWKALVKSIVKSYADVLGREDKDNIFEIKLERIIPMAQKFWKKLLTCKEGEVLFECNGAKTVSFKGDGVVGEYTVLNDENIHAIVNRVENERETKVPRISLYNPTNETMRPVARGYWPTGYEHRPGYATSRTVLSFLSSEPRTFTELVKKAPVSKPTLSRRLKNGVKDQLVAKTSEGYQLTAKGLYVRKAGNK
ncbi:unnamed protein product, partial [marine sediment metagenome]